MQATAEWLDTDYYEVLGVAPRRNQQTDQVGLSQARPNCPPRCQPR